MFLRIECYHFSPDSEQNKQKTVESSVAEETEILREGKKRRGWKERRMIVRKPQQQQQQRQKMRYTNQDMYITITDLDISTK